ncbi:unnamed protein product, partial [marine sediment metagenome]
QLNRIDKYHEKFMDLIRKKASSLNDVMRDLSEEELDIVYKMGVTSYVTSVVANFASHQHIKLYTMDKKAPDKLKESMRLAFIAVEKNMQKIQNNEPVNLTVIKRKD